MKTLFPDELSVTENYKLLIGSVLPRPIAFVSTISETGVYNLAPFSFFTGVCSKPLTIAFCPSIRGTDGHKKDTLINIEANGEFVVNVVSESFVDAMNITAGEFPPEISEFEVSGLTPIASTLITPPRVKESMIQMECRQHQIVTISEEVGGGYIVIGKVLAVHIAEELYDNGRIDVQKLHPVGRLAGSSYCTVNDIFEVARSSVKAGQ